MLLQLTSRVQAGGQANESNHQYGHRACHLICNHLSNPRLVGSLMVHKTLEMHLSDYKKAIIEQIKQYESHIFDRSDESFNAGIDRAIEAVEETEYVTK